MQIKSFLLLLPLLLLTACECCQSTSSTQSDTPAKVEKGYDYVCKEGDQLENIAHAYREAGVKVTVEDVIAANRGIDPNCLIPGQKLFIPAGR